MNRRLPLLCLLCALWLAGCRSTGLPRSGEVPDELTPAEVPAAIEAAEAALAEGRSAIALEWMFVASEVKGLPAEERARVQELLERAADRRLAELERSEGGVEELERLAEASLPRHIAVSAGIRAARLHLEAGEFEDAIELVRDLDERFPQHHERAAAGEILIEAALALSYDDSGFWIFHSARDAAFAGLEYATIHFPSDPRGAEAYWRLAEMYEEDGEYELAIERLEDLVLYFPEHPLRPAAQAQIPHLRLMAVTSPEYDRGALLAARAELETWLERYPTHERRAQVEVDLADCLARLAVSDLTIARFYRRVKSRFGARHHAARAREEARLAGDESLVEEAESLLAALPEAEGGEVDLPEASELERLLEGLGEPRAGSSSPSRPPCSPS